MTEIMELDSKLFSRLPDDIIYQICIYTGKFILRTDNKLYKRILVSIINLNEKIWVEFNNQMLQYFMKKMIYKSSTNSNSFQRYITRGGDMVIYSYIHISLPPSPVQSLIDNIQPVINYIHTKSHSESSSERLNKKRRRGDKIKFKMQFKK